MRPVTGWLVALLACAGAARPSARAADPVTGGAALYQARCGACHSVDANRAGPMHRNVFGRRAGSVPGFAYSEALRRSGVVWNDATLERWLRDPEAFIPGQEMVINVASEAERRQLIAYLRSVSAGAPAAAP